MILIQTTKRDGFLRTSQLSFRNAVLRTVIRFQPQTAVVPQLSLGAESLGSLDQGDQQRCPDRTLMSADSRRGKRPGRRDGAGGGAEIERGNRHGVAGSFGEARGTVEVCRGSRSSCGDLHERIDGETEVWRETGRTELRRGWVHDSAGHAGEAERDAIGGS